MFDQSSSLNFNQLLVVLYKVAPEDSPTLQSFMRYARTLDESGITGYRLVIWDNSPGAWEGGVSRLQEQFPMFQVQYIHTPENTSLSKIYNLVAAQIPDDSYLTLLDQDTSLPAEYFKELDLAQRKLEPLILPKVICQGRLVSPGSRFFARGRLLDSVPSGVVRSKNLLAINSGMSIRGSVLRTIRYDERLRFYGTDTFFMRNYEKYFDHAFVLETPISHSLAVMEKKSKDWQVAYTTELLRTLSIIYTNSIWEMLFVRAYSMFIRIKEGLNK